MRKLLLAGTALVALSSGTSAQSPFDGFYAAVGGSYGMGAGRTSQVRAYVFHDLQTGQPQGFSSIMAAGYNMTVGTFLFGIEADGRFGKESFGFSDVVGVSYPWSYIGNSNSTYDFSSDYSAHIAGRIGVTFGNTLLFGKLGLGATQVRETATVDEAGLLICSSYQVCLRRGGIGSLQSTTWLPAATAGIGVEHTMGRWFGRLSGEIEGVSLGFQNVSGTNSAGDRLYGQFGTGANSDTFWTARAMGMIGVRF